MSTPTSSTSSSRTSTWVGILLGVVLLGLIALFAIVLPKTTDAEAAESTAEAPLELVLPDTLPGGYAAADDPASFKGSQLAAQAATIAKQQGANSTYANSVLPKVLGRSAVSRTYVYGGTQAVYVQAFQSEGGAFAPNDLADPASGTAPTQMKQVGDGACILTFSQSAPGQPASTPAFTQCQVTHGSVTVQIGSAGIAPTELVEVAGGLADDLQS